MRILTYNIHLVKFYSLLLIGYVLLSAVGCKSDKDEIEPKDYVVSYKPIGSSAIPMQEHSRMTKTADGGVAIVYHALDLAHPETVMEDIYVNKYNNEGTLVWTYRRQESYQSYGHSIYQCTNGDLIIAGGKAKSQIVSDGAEVYLIRLTADGELVWKKSYPNKWYDEGVVIVEMSSGSFMVFVRSWSGNYLLKTQSNGDEIWRKDLEDECVTSEDLQAIEGDEFMMSGPNIKKFNSTGEVIWCYDPFTDPIFESIDIITLGRILPITNNEVMGFGQKKKDGRLTVECTYPFKYDYVMARINNLGTVEPPRTYTYSHTNNPISFDATSDGGYILLGESSDAITCESGEPILKVNLIKINANGIATWNYEFNLGQAVSVKEISPNHYVIMSDYLNFSFQHELQMTFFEKLL